MLGFVNALPSPLPPTAFPLQPGGCASLVDHEVIVPMPEVFAPPPQRRYADRKVVDVPLRPSLLGGVFFTQWWTVVRDSQVRTVLAVLGSDAALLLIGT